MDSIRHALRRLAKTPGFTVLAILILGLCIGANLTIFAVLDAILLRSLPFPEPERLVTLNNTYPAAGVERGGASIANYFGRRNAIEAFEAIGMYREIYYTVGEAENCRQVETARVTPGFFELLGVPLLLGREFVDDELDFSNGDVVILTHRFWRSYFNADPNILDRTFTMMNRPTTIAGVLPPDFRYLSSKAQIFRPLTHYRDRRGLENLHAQDGQMIARLVSGSSIAEAQSQLDAFNARQLENDPAGRSIAESGYRTEIIPLHDDHVRSVTSLLVLLQCGVLCLLLIGVVNLAGLLLIRASGDTKEMAVRKALGAGGWHIANRTLMETVLLAIAGGAVGVAFGVVGIPLIKHLGTELLPLGAEVVFDTRIVFVSVLASLLVGVAIALPIIWFNLRDRTNLHLQSDSRGSTSSRGVHYLRHGFIVTQMALAFVLLSAAGLLSASLKRTLEQSPGFDADQVLSGEVMVSYPDRRDRVSFVDRLETQLRTLPGVSEVAVSSRLPFTLDGTMAKPIYPEGMPVSPRGSLRTHTFASVTPGYWAAMNIPLLRGRLLIDSDGVGSARVAVVGKSLAQFYWPDSDPIGRRFSADSLSFYDRTLFGDVEMAFEEENAYTVVGVVNDVKEGQLTESESTGAVYFPYTGWAQLQIVLRTSVPPEVMEPTVRNLLRSLDPQLPLSDFRAMRSRIDDSLVLRESPAILAKVFAAVALLIAAVGIYGTLAYAVEQRRREIGVRMALGALRQQIGINILSMGMKLLVLGALLGFVGAWMAGRLMQSILFQVSPLHSASMVGTIAVIAFVTVSASILPAMRASRVDPMEALRAE